MGCRNEGFFGGPLEEEVSCLQLFLAHTSNDLHCRTLAIISGRSDDHISCTSNDKQKSMEVITEIRSASRPNLSSPTHAPKTPRIMAPFIAAHDIPRGAIHALQALLGYALMLAVMTFQAAYLISVIIGLGLGEVMFGRMGSGLGTH